METNDSQHPVDHASKPINVSESIHPLVPDLSMLEYATRLYHEADVRYRAALHGGRALDVLWSLLSEHSKASHDNDVTKLWTTLKSHKAEFKSVRDSRFQEWLEVKKLALEEARLSTVGELELGLILNRLEDTKNAMLNAVEQGVKKTT